METLSHSPRTTDCTVSTELKAEQCPVLLALSVIGGKWKLQILWSLSAGPLRYSQLRRKLTGISEKMLIQQLKNLEKEGLVVRKMYPEVPPRVEYELNQASRDLMIVLRQLKEWWNTHHSAVEQEETHEQKTN
jgi:DNA-binding HxlR family transcriptional regulator